MSVETAKALTYKRLLVDGRVTHSVPPQQGGHQKRIGKCILSN